MRAILNLKKNFVKNISNILGWSTNRKLVVFLVDDWGSIRIPNVLARRNLIKAGINCESNRFNKYDTLANAEDLSQLFNILSSHKDYRGVSPSFTALSIVANPDFDKIKQSGFKEYFYEPFTKTLDRYYSNENVFKLWEQGIEAGIFNPQFHGREHLNVELWLNGLIKNDHNLHIAFNNKSIGVPMSASSKYRGGYMAAFDFEYKKNYDELKKICNDGLDLFHRIFNYRALLFTSSSLLHPQRLESYLAEIGIEFVDRAKISNEPIGGGLYRKKFYRIGQANSYGQYYITRNCVFEPNQYQDISAVNQALCDIDISFRWRKPAIISSHRVNYVGGIDEANRAHGLKSLEYLLVKIKNKWPDVEFFKFAELASEINSKNH